MKFNNKIILLTLFTLTSCNPNLNDSDSFEKSKLIPEEVLNANVEIDILFDKQAEGYDTYTDIGKYDKPIEYVELFRFFSAAKEFNKIAPNVKINLITSENKGDYVYKKGHQPHLIVIGDSVNTIIPSNYIIDGSVTDLSRYADAIYFKKYNDNIVNSFNFGGFQLAFPLQFDPYGVFVNLDHLQEGKVVSEVLTNGLCSEEYKEYVDNFTYDSFVDSVRKTTTATHVGLDYLNTLIPNLSLDNFYSSIVKNNYIDLDGKEAIVQTTKLLECENELSKYCLYEYGTMGYRYKDQFFNAAPWNVKKNFIIDKYSTFSAEFPWNLSTISYYAKQNSVEFNLDYLPYPKIDGTSSFKSGVSATGVAVGNLCPIGLSGAERCYSSNAKLEMDVASYFAMFMSIDPRAHNAYYEMRTTNNEKGVPLLPLVEKNIAVDLQNDFNISSDFDDLFNYQLSYYLQNNDLLITDDKLPDVVNYTNVKYGFAKVLNTIYGENPTAIYLNHTPSLNIMSWSKRYHNSESIEGSVGTDSYVTTILSKLDRIEKDLNYHIDDYWLNIQNGLDKNYGKNKYKVI